MEINEFNCASVLCDLYAKDNRSMQKICADAGVGVNNLNNWCNKKNVPDLKHLCMVLHEMGYRLEVAKN